MRTSDLYGLVDERVQAALGEPLASLLARWDTDGRSLRDMAERLGRITGRTPAPNTVRAWLARQPNPSTKETQAA